MPDDLKTLASELGIADLAPEKQEALVEGFGEAAFKAAIAAVLEKLPEEKRETFAALLEAGDVPALKAFLDKEVPEHEQLAGAAVRDELANLKASINQ